MIRVEVGPAAAVRFYRQAAAELRSRLVKPGGEAAQLRELKLAAARRALAEAGREDAARWLDEERHLLDLPREVLTDRQAARLRRLRAQLTRANDEIRIAAGLGLPPGARRSKRRLRDLQKLSGDKGLQYRP